MHAAVLTVETPNTQLILDATEGQQLALLYYGDPSATLEDITQLLNGQINDQMVNEKMVNAY
ncbi:MAG: hypothetical protein K5660_08830, partial [Paludibacteraceae bacterium]|nr:hypothetical protein [Paludibacteraceae bacterium]